MERLRHEAGILDLKITRAEQGKPNDSLAIITTAPVEELPLPPWLAEKRLRILQPGTN